jgi:hypothetical protein
MKIQPKAKAGDDDQQELYESNEKAKSGDLVLRENEVLRA